jgi:hypothetical protein
MAGCGFIVVVVVVIIIIIIIIVIIIKSSVDRYRNYCHYVVLRKAGFAITLYYHPTDCDVNMLVYRLLCGFLICLLVWVGGLG